jgi:hypothetical protein
MDEFKEMASAALTLAGVPVGEGDLDVLEMIARAFEPGMHALDGADLTQLPLEGDLDPGRPPRPMLETHPAPEIQAAS